VFVCMCQPDTRTGGQEKHTNLCPYRWCHDLDLNRTPPKYKLEADLLGVKKSNLVQHEW
jgi:hypothetical protein